MEVFNIFRTEIKKPQINSEIYTKIQKANLNLNQNSFRSRARTLYEHALDGTRKEGKRGRGYTGGGEDMETLL
jgi:hypothetical protein